MSSRGVRRSGDKPPRRLSSNDRSLDPKGGCSNFGRQSNNSGNNNSPRSRNRNSGFRQRSSTADERRLRNGNSRKFYRNQQPKREAVSAGCFAPSTNSSKSGRNGRSGNNNTVKSEAALLPIEWRCRTPPQRHDEVHAAVQRSRKALESADRVARSIKIAEQNYFNQLGIENIEDEEEEENLDTALGRFQKRLSQSRQQQQQQQQQKQDQPSNWSFHKTKASPSAVVHKQPQRWAQQQQQQQQQQQKQQQQQQQQKQQQQQVVLPKFDGLANDSFLPSPFSPQKQQQKQQLQKKHFQKTQLQKKQFQPQQQNQKSNSNTDKYSREQQNTSPSIAVTRRPIRNGGQNPPSQPSTVGPSPRVRRRRATRSRQVSHDCDSRKHASNKSPSIQNTSYRKNTSPPASRPTLSVDVSANGNTSFNTTLKSSPSPRSSAPPSPRSSSGVPSGARVLKVSDLRQNSQNNKAALKKRRNNNRNI